MLGHFNAGFSAQDFTASLVLQASPDLRFKRATRVENACATGSAAVHGALKSIAARSARIVLVVGVEQMTTTPPAEIGRNLLKASYVREEADIDGGFAGIFGKIAGLYFQRWGDQSDALARIAAKNHKNGVGNPYAQIRKDLGYDFCRAESEKNPLVAGPLKRTDCSLVSDGAAALVLADVETALKLDKAIVFRAAQHVQDFLPMSRRDILKFEGCAVAWQRALAQAGIGLKDLSFAEVHDCFTIAELIEYEAMGLAPEGQGARAIADGTRRQGRRAADQSVRRTEGQGSSDRRHRRVDARARRDAAHRHGRRHAGQGRQARRHFQHGRRRGRQLRQHPGTVAVRLYRSVIGRHELRLHQLGEKAAAALQLVERAGLDDAAILKHQDAGGAAHGGEPVRDDEGGAALHHFVERSGDPRLGHRIERAGCLVEDQDRRVLEQGPRDSEALTLAAGQKPPAFADARLKTLGIAVDEVERLRARRRLAHLARRWRPVCRRANSPRSSG